jgi:parallel beta-helix repeat protein
MTRKQRILLAVAGSLVAVAGAVLLLSGSPRVVRADPGTLYVAPPPGGSDGNPCSLGQPCATVQHAVDTAIAGDEIHIATGIYTGVQARAGMTQVVYISKTVTLRGGYSGDFATWDPATYPATLDAQGQGRVVSIISASDVTLEGLSITGGNAANAGSGSNPAGAGGGIYAASDAGITLISDRIYSNTASYGGGAWFYLSYGARLESNDIHSNTAAVQGGGIGSQYGQVLVLTDNRVFDNAAEGASGGGLYLFDADGSTLTRNEIISNTADDWGGAIFFSASTDVTLENNVIAGNYGTAAIYLHQSGNSHIVHTTIARNDVNSAGVYLSEGAYWLTNTILVSHTVGIRVQPGATATLAATLWGTATWANDTDWTNNGTLITGTLNWWESPDFANPDGWDYHIGASSGALDRGVNAGVSTDIDGEPRFCSPPDLGADEYWPPGTPSCIYLPLALRND